MREVHVSDQAKRDLIGIWEYIAADSPRAADRLIQTLVNTYLRLGVTPGMGRDRSELRPGVRSMPVGNYLIFYRFNEERVFVVRVLHGARNLRAVLKKETEETYTKEDEG
jgi:toxin ParE1/3/4